MASDVKYVTLTEKNFENEVVQSSKPVLVDFWAAWCGPCRAVAPAIEELARNFDGIATVGKVNVDEEPQLAVRFGVQSIPTLLFFQNGKIVDQMVGAAPTAVLAARLQRLIPTA